MLAGKYAVMLSRNARGSGAIAAAKAMAAELGVTYLDRPHNQVLEEFMVAQGLEAVRRMGHAFIASTVPLPTIRVWPRLGCSSFCAVRRTIW